MSPQGQQPLRHIPPDIYAVSSAASHRHSVLSHPSTAENTGGKLSLCTFLPSLSFKVDARLAVSVYCVACEELSVMHQIYMKWGETHVPCFSSSRFNAYLLGTNLARRLYRSDFTCEIQLIHLQSINQCLFIEHFSYTEM